MSKKIKLDLRKEQDRETAVQWLEESDDDYLSEKDSLSDDSELDDNLEVAEYEPEFLQPSESDSNDSDKPVLGAVDSTFISKNGTVWKNRPLRQTRCRTKNLLEKPGLTEKSKNVAKISDCFKLFVDEKIVEIIVKCTNQKAEKYFQDWNGKNPNKTRTWMPTDSVEIYAVLGLLITAGALKANREPVHFLWCRNPLYSRSIFPAAMSRDRFLDLISLMRFDDLNIREERRSSDKLAAFREVFTKFEYK
ncbi:uncharacterized protein [Diabrotica undecimpunctata]|uniref:uncharacterized protein n=1 Tax=Diabrotica undecimpunctata TaxID=50387 RepID=UPI003B634A1B